MTFKTIVCLTVQISIFLIFFMCIKKICYKKWMKYTFFYFKVLLQNKVKEMLLFLFQIFATKRNEVNIAFSVLKICCKTKWRKYCIFYFKHLKKNFIFLQNKMKKYCFFFYFKRFAIKQNEGNVAFFYFKDFLRNKMKETLPLFYFKLSCVKFAHVKFDGSPADLHQTFNF